PGSSAVVDRAFVTSSNEAKQAMLGVPVRTLERYGAVSRQTASAMARGALANSDADIAVAITGVAGPGGGTAKKPVGLVHFYALGRDGRKVRGEKRYGRIGRATVRMRSVAEAAAILKHLASGGPSCPGSHRAVAHDGDQHRR